MFFIFYGVISLLLERAARFGFPRGKLGTPPAAKLSLLDNMVPSATGRTSSGRPPTNADVRRGGPAALKDEEAFLRAPRRGGVETTRAVVSAWTVLRSGSRRHRLASARATIAHHRGAATWQTCMAARLRPSGSILDGCRRAVALPSPTWRNLDGVWPSSCRRPRRLGGRGFFLAFPLPEVDATSLSQLFDWIVQMLGQEGYL
jgi:hypothetical protein